VAISGTAILENRGTGLMVNSSKNRVLRIEKREKRENKKRPA